MLKNAFVRSDNRLFVTGNKSVTLYWYEHLRQNGDRLVVCSGRDNGAYRYNNTVYATNIKVK